MKILNQQFNFGRITPKLTPSTLVHIAPPANFIVSDEKWEDFDENDICEEKNDERKVPTS